MFRTVVDCASGESEQIPLTDEEIAEIQARPAEPAPPARCDPWQIRKALIALGLDEQVEAAVAASDDKVLKAGWHYAPVFSSDDPFVLSMGAALGKNADETRDLIAFAATL